MHSNIYWIPTRWLDADVIKIKRKSLLCREFSAFGGRQTCTHSIVQKTPKLCSGGSRYIHHIRYMSTKNLLMNVHCSIFHNSQKAETQIPFSWKIHKQNVVYPYNRNRNESWKHYAKWTKLVTKGHTLYDSIYVKCPNRQIYKEEK